MKQCFQLAIMIIMSLLVIVSTSINQYVNMNKFDAIKSFQRIFNASLDQFSGAVDISNGISAVCITPKAFKCGKIDAFLIHDYMSTTENIQALLKSGSISSISGVIISF